MSNKFVALCEGTYETTIGAICGSLTEGQLIHMANHLWKHYEVGATALLKQREPTPYVVVDGVFYDRREEDL